MKRGTAFAQHVLEDAGWLAGDVLEDENAQRTDPIRHN
jgi:hypothetical protein